MYLIFFVKEQVCSSCDSGVEFHWFYITLVYILCIEEESQNVVFKICYAFDFTF